MNSPDPEKQNIKGDGICDTHENDNIPGSLILDYADICENQQKIQDGRKCKNQHSAFKGGLQPVVSISALVDAQTIGCIIRIIIYHARPACSS